MVNFLGLNVCIIIVLTSIGVDECPAIVPLNSKLLAKEADISRKQSIGKYNFVSLIKFD